MIKTKELLPVNLQGDKNLEGLSSAIDKVFSLEELLDVLLVYMIDQAPADALPYLAWQFHVEGWEMAQTEAERRALVKSAIELHKYKGTAWAVEKVFEVLRIEAEIKEWFEYGGEPYKFRIFLKTPIRDENTYFRLIDFINEYKNERSWIDSIGSHREYSGNVRVGMASYNGKFYDIPLYIKADIDPAGFYPAFFQVVGKFTTIGVYTP